MVFVPSIDDVLGPIIGDINRDRKLGLEKLAALAEKGEKSAIFYMGVYLAEDGENDEEAAKWLLLANEFESPGAAWNLAMIARARGDVDEMRKWLDRAAHLGEEDAIEICASSYDVDAFLEKLQQTQG
jgi:TPR repeat protein